MNDEIERDHAISRRVEVNDEVERDHAISRRVEVNDEIERDHAISRGVDGKIKEVNESGKYITVP